MKLFEVVEKYFIVENRVEFLQGKFIPLIKKFNKMEEDDRNANEKSKKIFDQIVEADPTKNKMYTQWLLNLYINGKLLLEDLYKATEDLIVFTQKKHLLPVEQRDIIKIQSINDLFRIVKPLHQMKTGKEEKEETKNEAMKDVTVVYSGPEGKILIPKTKEASCFLGKGTRWCTASENAHNYFDHYNKSGPLYVIFTNDNKKWQIHFESHQMMDDEDESSDVFGKYPWVLKVLAEKLTPEFVCGHFPQYVDKFKFTEDQIIRMSSYNEKLTSEILKLEDAKDKSKTPQLLERLSKIYNSSKNYHQNYDEKKSINQVIRKLVGNIGGIEKIDPKLQIKLFMVYPLAFISEETKEAPIQYPKEIQQYIVEKFGLAAFVKLDKKDPEIMERETGINEKDLDFNF